MNQFYIFVVFSNRYFKAAAEASDLLAKRELFSFGSGCFYDGRDAIEVLESGSEHVISCTITMESLIILDKKKALGHLSSMPCIDKAVPLRELLAALEDVGEATNAKHCVLISISFDLS